ncbi:hypothetical protein NN561_007204 [Cricetulus griseus]
MGATARSNSAPAHGAPSAQALAFAESARGCCGTAGSSRGRGVGVPLAAAHCSSETRSGRSLDGQYRRLDCACASVAFAADRAGSSFLGRKDSSAMESYDVIANQPVVIDNHPVLLTEAPLNPRKNRERAAEVFFETFNVPALFISMQAVLSLYATGRTTGVVLDSGDGVTHAVPIYEGFAMPHSIMRIDIAGRDVSRFLRLYLRKEGYDFHSSSEFEIVKAIKERACYLSINPQKDETLETEKAQYYLPDGSTIEIGPSRFRAPELLFRPDLIGEESEGIHEVLVFAIQKSDMDLRRTLFSNIVLSGGSTLFKGFGDRLLSEVKKLAPKDVKIRVGAHWRLGREELGSMGLGVLGVAPSRSLQALQATTAL